MAISDETRAAALAALHDHEHSADESHRKLTSLDVDADASARIKSAVERHKVSTKAFSDDILGIVGNQRPV